MTYVLALATDDQATVTPLVLVPVTETLAGGSMSSREPDGTAAAVLRLRLSARTVKKYFSPAAFESCDVTRVVAVVAGNSTSAAELPKSAGFFEVLIRTTYSVAHSTGDHDSEKSLAVGVTVTSVGALTR
jgi:hypothetical protein